MPSSSRSTAESGEALSSGIALSLAYKSCACGAERIAHPSGLNARSSALVSDPGQVPEFRACADTGVATRRGNAFGSQATSKALDSLSK